MAKGIDLERHLARTGPWGAPTIAHLRKRLRVENMLHCSGQGTAARNIVASDVTAFFLGLTAADEKKNAPAVIRLARASRVYLDASENCDPWPFAGISPDQTLGDFLDALFAGRISSASDPGFNLWDMRFELQIMPGDFRFFAKLIFEIGGESHVVKFLGINERIRANLDREQDCELPLPPQVDRVCIVRTKFLRDLITFTVNALSSDTGQAVGERPELSRDNPFWNNGHKHAPNQPNRDGGE